jgi:Big-like domain-containing protein
LKRSLYRAGAGIGATLLVMSALLVTATTAQAVGDGTIVVNVVDQYGRPAVGYLNGVSAAGGSVSENPPPGPSGSTSTHTFTVTPGGYSFISVTPWSGFFCFGYAPCNQATAVPGGTVTPVVTVAADSIATYTAKVTVPTISGGTTAGAPLALQIPPGLTALQNYILAEAHAPTFTQQWLRGSSDVSGATGLSYTPTRDESGQPIAARLSPASGLLLAFGPSGVPVQPFTTNAITQAKFVPIKTKTKVGMPKRIKLGQKVSATIKVKAATGTPAGDVTIIIDKFKAQKSLKRGKLFFSIPHLPVGRYTMKVAFTGSDDYARSKAKKITFTVYK